MTTSNIISFPGNMEALDSMIDWIHDQVIKMAFSADQQNEIEVAMEEALVNIIVHAYKEHPGTIELICQLEPGKQIAFTIKDQGFPFNPLLQTSQLKADSPLEQRKEGGLGIFFMRKYMDKVSYERLHSYNVLTLIKSAQ